MYRIYYNLYCIDLVWVSFKIQYKPQNLKIHMSSNQSLKKINSKPQIVQHNRRQILCTNKQKHIKFMSRCFIYTKNYLLLLLLYFIPYLGFLNYVCGSFNNNNIPIYYASVLSCFFFCCFVECFFFIFSGH